jgi:putative hydrolase of the HAD superfamily
MNKGKVTDVFFDLDHTLWDFERNSELTYSQIFFDLQIEVQLPEFLEVYIPKNMHFWKLYREGKIDKETLRYRRLKTVFDELGYPIGNRKIDQISEAYIEVLGNQTHLMPYAREILDYLNVKYRLHIITNGFEQVQCRKLKNSGIDHYFHEVIPSERAGVQKPHPDIFKLALNAAEVSSNNAVMIGDSLEADILGALSAGMQAIHFNTNKEAPHQHCPIIEHLEEIKHQL